MTSDDIAQLTSAHASHGTWDVSDGRTVPFVLITLTCLHQKEHKELLPVAMTPDQAQTIAMQLLQQVEKATAGSPTPGPRH